MIMSPAVGCNNDHVLVMHVSTNVWDSASAAWHFRSLICSADGAHVAKTTHSHGKGIHLEREDGKTRAEILIPDMTHTVGYLSAAHQQWSHDRDLIKVSTETALTPSNILQLAPPFSSVQQDAPTAAEFSHLLLLNTPSSPPPPPPQHSSFFSSSLVLFPSRGANSSPFGEIRRF